MSTNRVPKYRHYKPKNLGVVRIDGRDRYLGEFNSPESHERYHRLIADWLAGNSQLTLARSTNSASRIAASEEPYPLRIKDLILRYWGFVQIHYVKNGEPTTEQSCIRGALKPLRRLYGDTNAADFGPVALKNVRETMIQAGLCRYTVNKHVGRVKRLFAWAVESELLRVDVYQALLTVRGLQRGRSLARETAKVRPVAPSEVEAVRPALSPVLQAMIRLQWLTGARPTEVCQMRPCDLDTSGEVWMYSPQLHKTEHHDRERCIFIGPLAQQILTPFLHRPAQAFCFDPRESVEFDRALSTGSSSQAERARRPRPSRRQHMYNKNTFRRAVVRACERLGIRPWNPNQLRHTRATEIRKAFGLEGAQVSLGHAKADITQTYAERDHRLAADIMRQIG